MGREEYSSPYQHLPQCSKRYLSKRCEKVPNKFFLHFWHYFSSHLAIEKYLKKKIHPFLQGKASLTFQGIKLYKCISYKSISLFKAQPEFFFWSFFVLTLQLRDLQLTQFYGHVMLWLGLLWLQIWVNGTYIFSCGFSRLDPVRFRQGASKATNAHFRIENSVQCSSSYATALPLPHCIAAASSTLLLKTGLYK